VIPSPNASASYDLALANKLFDAIMAGMPIGVGPHRAKQHLVSAHRIGVVFDETDPADIARAITGLEEMSRDPAGSLAERLAKVQPEIAWERQEDRLVRLYDALRSHARSRQGAELQ
jgi:hypothetical protein